MPERSKFETILKWIVLVIVALVALNVALKVLFVAAWLGKILLFTVLPLVLLVWGAFKLVEWIRGRNGGYSGGYTEPDPNS
ncbi:MAG TPA: hypothetical protein VF746_13685 [Longimicrobium sp.]|jgi:hypothetical protein